MNISLEIDKKIDELIHKNIEKDYIQLKIQTNMLINDHIIKISLISLIYSILIYFIPFYLNIAFYSIILLPIPFSILAILVEYKNSYLKYSNDMARLVVNSFSIYIFTCLMTFIILIIFRLSEISLVYEISNIIYCIPVLGILISITALWLFLHTGYKNLSEMNKYYFYLVNIIIGDFVSLIIILKIIYQIKFILWIHITIFICLIYVFDNIYLLNIEKRKSEDSLIIVLNILMKICLLSYICLLGLYLDYKLDKMKHISLFILVWFFLFITVIKYFYKNKKIQNYFEWKKMVII